MDKESFSFVVYVTTVKEQAEKLARRDRQLYVLS